ncbi:hypothetical protein DPEC_G00026810 [Dallia pectoralis]|uniref:Uncharacterized protein n=1 Tax=Dallia pectoralis TaxID=75939 RepID=A0ACC2HJ53_DALPE|nr:hypothetical protein DPEC_G00026810 [Dallia pectoralis]
MAKTPLLNHPPLVLSARTFTRMGAGGSLAWHGTRARRQPHPRHACRLSQGRIVGAGLSPPSTVACLTRERFHNAPPTCPGYRHIKACDIPEIPPRDVLNSAKR